jgi:hypothetical protein
MPGSHSSQRLIPPTGIPSSRCEWRPISFRLQRWVRGFDTQHLVGHGLKYHSKLCFFLDSSEGAVRGSRVCPVGLETRGVV